GQASVPHCGPAGAPSRPARLLDVGCGSGILAIAAGLLGAGAIVAVDTDPVAVEATLANARRNRVARRLRAWRGSLPSGAGPFDLVAANLIASVLVTLAADLAAELRPAGRLLASGIFVDREADVQTAFAGAGLSVLRREAEGDWVALEAERPERAGSFADECLSPDEAMSPVTEHSAGTLASPSARRQRYLADAITTAVGFNAFLMSTKPALW
ncbi:MAG: 50S ribosomal protein L11 methyltransferase, partial [Chloroflexota bacterium]